MNYDQFFESVSRKDISIDITSEGAFKRYQLNNEALFQLPLISMIVLLLAKDRRKPFVSELGQLVGDSIEDAMISFKKTSQHLGWSANLRIRTVKALGFLERSSLIEINKSDSRVCATALGVKVVAKALEEDNDLSYNLSLIRRAYRNICINRQFELELV